MSEYTPGRLAYIDGRIDAVDFRKPTTYPDKVTGEPIAYMTGLVAIPYFCGDASAEGNARRLVACWNACIGIPTDELEKQAEFREAAIAAIAKAEVAQ